MKKLLAALLAAILVLGCVSALAEDPFASLGYYEMIVGHAQPEGNPRWVSLEKFAEDVREKTYGHLTVTVYGNSQLGTEKKMLQEVIRGEIQGMRGGQYDFSPRLLMFTAPFLTKTRAEVTALLHSDLAKRVCAEAEGTTGTLIINLCDAGGYRQIANNVRPVTRPEDLQGLKMRTNGMMTNNLTFRALGADVISIPYSHLYESLKYGEADGQENPWVNILGMKFYEVQKYFTEVNYQFHPDPFYVNANWWSSLPAKFQTVLMECAAAMGEYNDQLIDENSEAARQEIIASGAEVYTPTLEELHAFRDACRGVYQKMIDGGICTQAEMDEMLAIVEAAGK